MEHTLDYASNTSVRPRLKALRVLLLTCAALTISIAVLAVLLPSLHEAAQTKFGFTPPTITSKMYAIYGTVWTAIALFCERSIRTRRAVTAARWLALGLVTFIPIGTVIGLWTFIAFDGLAKSEADAD